MYDLKQTRFCSRTSVYQLHILSRSGTDDAVPLCSSSLTPAVVEEALTSPTVFIVTYHPPIFKPLTSLTLSVPLQASLLRCAAAGISVYCPHTALDSVTDGINDWLCTKAAGPLRDINWTARFIGQEFPEGLGGQGRIVTLKQPIELGQLAATIRTELELKEGERLWREHEHWASGGPELTLDSTRMQSTSRTQSPKKSTR